MLTLKLGFALEGNSDYPVIPCLALRIIHEYDSNIPTALLSPLRPRKRGHGFIKELPTFIRQLNDEAIDIAVAVVDTDDTRVNERRKMLKEAGEECEKNGIPVYLAYGIAVHALEAWLYADPNALFDIYDGNRSSIQFPNPENDQTPKLTLNRIIRVLTNEQEVSFISRAADLTNRIDLSILGKTCRHFNDFRDNLIGCVKRWQQVKGTA
jgi:hypothetical protein